MVDIVMATYNGEKYIREQLDSILNQSYKRIHLVIRDDGSKDNTVEIIKEYKCMYGDCIELIEDSVKCGSSKSNFMQAMKYTSANYVMFSDQDDYWLPDKIQHTLDKMLEIEGKIGKDKPILVFGSYKPVDEKLDVIKEKQNKRQEAAYKIAFSNLLVQNYINGCLMMVNRILVDKMGNYDDAILMHDWWAALIAAGGGEIEHIDEVMMLYRQHEGNVVGAVNVKSLNYRLSKFLSPETKKANHQYLNQARILLERNANDLNESNLLALKKFIDLYKKSKIGRVIGLIQGNYLKSDFVRVVGQVWYI